MVGTTSKSSNVNGMLIEASPQDHRLTDILSEGQENSTSKQSALQSKKICLVTKDKAILCSYDLQYIHQYIKPFANIVYIKTNTVITIEHL